MGAPNKQVDIASDLMRPPSAGHRHSPEYLMQQMLINSSPELGMQSIADMGMSPQEAQIVPQDDWFRSADERLAQLLASDENAGLARANDRRSTIDRLSAQEEQALAEFNSPAARAERAQLQAEWNEKQRQLKLARGQQ